MKLEQQTMTPSPVDALLAAGVEVRSIPTVPPDAGDPVEIANHSQVPMLFKGHLSDWAGRQAWCLDTIGSVIEDEEVTVLDDLPREGVLFPRPQKDYERRMPFSEFLRAARDTDSRRVCYLAYTRVLDLKHGAELPLPPLVERVSQEGADVRSWIGSEGTRSMLHSDLKDNFFCQLDGRKSVTLLRWCDSRSAYPFVDNLVNSEVDLAAPDLARHPRLLEVPFFHAVVEPGDVVFIPRGCWHDLRSLTASVSVNVWFGDPINTAEYLRLLLRLGPRHWRQSLRDLTTASRQGGEDSESRFFFSPPSTGRRLRNLLRGRSFSADNDPVKE